MLITRVSVRVLVAVLLSALAAGSLIARPAAAATDSQLVLVLDSSGSMKEKVGGRSKISIAKSALKTVVRKLPGDARVGLRVYGATVFDRSDKGACTDSQLVVPIGTDNRSALRAEIEKYEPYGETPISYSLRQAAGDLGEGGKRSILLVSDGEETCAANPCKTAAALTKKNIDVKVDVVGLAVSGSVRNQLRCIADKGNGTYYDANSRADLEDSLDKLATRAFRPFRVTGTPIEGSTRKKTAPTVGPGQYVDQIPGDLKKLYYRIPHTIAGSTIHVGFTVPLKPGAGSFKLAVLNMALYDAKGHTCAFDLNSGNTLSGSAPLVGLQLDSWQRDEGDPCWTDDLLLAIDPAYDLAGVRFELLVNEEPPVVSARNLPPASADLKWSSMRHLPSAGRIPVGGSSFSDAAVLTTGVYRGRVLTGEDQVYAVQTDWGQRVQVEAVIAPRRGSLARALNVSEHLDLQLFSPYRGPYSNLAAAGMPRWDNTLIEDADAFHTGGTTPVVRWTNRTQTDSVGNAAQPGLQYIAVNMSRSSQGHFLVPYTLKVKILGQAGRGRPQYVGGPSTSPTPAATPTTTPSETAPPRPPDQASSGVPLAAVVGIGLGAVALGVGGGFVAARRRRRNGAS